MYWCLSLLFTLLTTSLESTAPDREDTVIAAPGYTIQTVVIDPGHGGKDPGCLGSSHREKDIALKIGLQLGAMINEAYPGVKVIFTRDKDVFVPLNERARIANRAHADVFISIHCNTAAKRNTAHGTETYILGLHRAEDNLKVAKRENAAILLEDDYIANYDGYDPESDEGHIIMSMFQNAHLEQSITLAYHIEDQFARQLKRKSRGVKQAGFLVLRNTAMPSVLVEAGFLSHDAEEAFLASNSGQQDMAKGIFNAFTEYKNNYERSSIVTESPDDPGEPTVDFFVQLAASAKQIDLKEHPWKMYDNIQVRKENDYYKYLVGPFDTIGDAELIKTKLSGDGFEQAFVVAYRGNARVSLQDLAKEGQ